MSGATAPGAPGLPPTWSSSAKEMVGCSLGPSRLWFTIGGGILNEVYHPRVDIPQIRDLGFIVADGRGFWVEVKRMYRHSLTLAAPGVPAVRIVHRHERFELTLRVVPAHERDVLLMEIELTGDESLRPYALLAPHLGGTGNANSASIAGHRGHRVLWAEQGPYALALAAVTSDQQDAWGRASCGCVGTSDGWQDFAHNDAMTWEYANAGPGNIALTGELPRKAVLALGFGSSTESAATLALSALFEPFEAVWQRQIDDWSGWHRECAGRWDAVRRTASRVRGSVQAIDDGVARASRQDVSRRDGGEPERPLGQHQGGAGGLSPRLAARSVRMRRGVARGRRDARGSRYAALPSRHAACGWSLESEPVARRQALLDRCAAR